MGAAVNTLDRLAQQKHFLALDGVRHKTIRETFQGLVQAGIREETFNGPSVRVNLTAHEEANPQYRDEVFRPKYFEPLVRDLAGQGLAPEEIYEEALWRLIPAEAAKQLVQRHRESRFLVGYASTEILTKLVTDEAANDPVAFQAKVRAATEAILSAKRRMRRLAGGDNFFIKVPVTQVGLIAAREAWLADFAALAEAITRDRWAPVLNINFTAISTLQSFLEALQMALWAKRQFAALGGDPSRGPAAEARLSYFVRSLDDLIDGLAKERPALDPFTREARTQAGLPTVSLLYFHAKIYETFQRQVREAPTMRPPLIIAGSTAVKIQGKYQWAGSDAYALRVRLPYVINTTPIEVIDPLLAGLASGEITGFDRVVSEEALAQSRRQFDEVEQTLASFDVNLEALQAATHRATIQRFLQDESAALAEIAKVGERVKVMARP